MTKLTKMYRNTGAYFCKPDLPDFFKHWIQRAGGIPTTCDPQMLFVTNPHLPPSTLRTGVFIPTCASWIASWTVASHNLRQWKNILGQMKHLPVFFWFPKSPDATNMVKNAWPAAGSKLPQSLEF